MAKAYKQTFTSNNMPNTTRPSHAERIKTLLHAQQTGTLSTQSCHQAGYPFGSMMPYALDAQDQPLFLISTLAMHTQNILANPKTSLYVAENVQEGEPLTAARLTLMGDIHQTTDDMLRQRYLEAHPNASFWVDFDDFSFYRMTVSNAYFVGGFGEMGWVDKADYQQAIPDLLLAIASDVIQHMNQDHADALILLAKHQEDTAIDIDEAQMVNVDRLGFGLKLRIGEDVRTVRIAFPTPINNADDIRSVFVAMVNKVKSSN